jgi:hypothetical protein
LYLNELNRYLHGFHLNGNVPRIPQLLAVQTRTWEVLGGKENKRQKQEIKMRTEVIMYTTTVFFKCYTELFYRKMSTFWRDLLPLSPDKKKIDAKYVSETFVLTCQIIRRHISDDPHFNTCYLPIPN